MSANIAWVLENDPKYKDCVWFLIEDQSLENLNWGSTKDVEDNSIPKPTQAELDEYFDANKTAHDNAVNVSQRKYPSIAEQLDMIYHDIDNWKAKIKEIKDANPKA
tara:strand:- start:167 stop:484 length:318 start_codon:yes stop_codon:yes gene_type:complete